MQSQAGPVRVLNAEEISSKLSRLSSLLKRLPTDLPLGRQFYYFEDFSASREDEEDYGPDGAINRHFEITFCPGGRQKGLITFKEHGPGLEAVVGVLAKALQLCPESVVLQKWIFDLYEAAESRVSKSKLKPRRPPPTVKFRDLAKVLKTVASDSVGARITTGAEAQDDGETSSDSEDEAETIEEEAREARRDVLVADLNSLALRDILADAHFSMNVDVPKEIVKVTPSQTAQKRVLTEADWRM